MKAYRLWKELVKKAFDYNSTMLTVKVALYVWLLSSLVLEKKLYEFAQILKPVY